MEWPVILAGLAGGLALAVGRLWIEQRISRRLGLPPQILFRDRDVIIMFLVLSTAANLYGAYLIASGAPGSFTRLSAWIGMAMLVASQLIAVALAVHPTRRDLDLALVACIPYLYLFALWVAALILNSYTLWFF